MNLTLYTNSSDNRVVNKSLTQIGLSTVSAVFKGDGNMITPVLELAYDANFMACNYIYIDIFSRYYYVTKMTVSQQRLIFECRIDVLQSHASAIAGFYALVARQADREKQANLYLHDKEFRALAYKDTETIVFKNSRGKWVKLLKDMNMVLTVAGGGN